MSKAVLLVLVEGVAPVEVSVALAEGAELAVVSVVLGIRR